MISGTLYGRLVDSAGDAWRSYTRHEFVLRLARGDLPEAAFRRYLVQDYLFLLHFARAWGLAVYKSDTLAEMRRAQSFLAAILDVEIGLHIDYCRGWGLSEAALNAEPEAPDTVAYTRFVLDRGVAGDRLDLEIALAPCMIGYAEIAAERIADPATRHDGNPYRDWLLMYSGDEYQTLARECSAALDEQFARRGGEGRRGAPNPLIRCQGRVQFRDPLGNARGARGGGLAAGHYAPRGAGPAGPELHRAADPSRDQSYFLCRTTRSELEFLRFPLGELQKDETRRLARELALPVAAKPDSQDICFVPQGSYAAIVERLRPEAGEPGDIVDQNGRVLGRHNGIAYFTVGQRKGLGIAATEPFYVLRLDPENRRVIVGPKSALCETCVHLGELNWLGPPLRPGEMVPVSAKVRSTQPPVPATLHAGAATGAAELLLSEPAGAIAPGQAAVLYDGERLLGGGWIRRVPENPALQAAETGAAAA